MGDHPRPLGYINVLGRITSALLIVASLPLLVHQVDAQSVPGFRRGDCNGDSQVNLADPIATLCALFFSETPPCEDACDRDDNGVVDTSDVILALATLFGPAPPLVHALDCGWDLTSDSLGCGMPSCTALEIVETRCLVLPSAETGNEYVARLPAEAWEQIDWSTGFDEGLVREAVPFTRYGLLPGESLPQGLTVDSRTGDVFGVAPSPGVHQFRLWAKWDDTNAALFDIELAVFAAHEPEVVAGQDFTVPGPTGFTLTTGSFEFLHENTWPPPYPLWQCAPLVEPWPALETKPYEIYLPGGDQPGPLVIFHHGTGFDYLDYSVVLSHLASYGVTCVSVDDTYSFGEYVVHYCWGGQHEAARVMLATRTHLEALAANPSSPVAGRIDWARVFYAGHSRGAAAAIIASELDPNTRGVIALQPTDAKGDSWIGYTSRWVQLPNVPVLVISAEQDFDVSFPWSERLLERMQGPTTQVTIYGGCHGYTADTSTNGCQECNWVQAAPWLDYCRYISRDQQHRWTQQFTTAFLRRYAFADLSVEGILYGSEYQTSSRVGVAHRRAHARTRWIDDFSEFPNNSLGALTSSAGGSVGVGACYDQPNSPPAPLTPIENLVVTMSSAPSMTHHTSPLQTPLGPLDASQHAFLKFRIKNADRWSQVDNFGYGWLDFELALEDGEGDIATIDVGPYLPSVTFHPEPEPVGTLVRMKYQRFISVSIPLAAFTLENPNLDLDRLTGLDWSWGAWPGITTAPTIAIDDVILE